MSNFQLNIPITKVDEEQRIVYGYATKEELDRQGDIVDYEAAKKAFSEWPGNIREQHDPKRAIGKNTLTEFDDENKQILIGAKISRSADGVNAWTKVQEGIFTGFSIGGKIFKTIRDTIKTDDGEVSANRITDFSLSEVSLVDVPACPSAQFVMVKSLDGKLERVEEMHEVQTEPWFFKAFAFAPEQVNRLADSSDTKNMSKQSKELEMSKDIEKVNVHGGEERDSNANATDKDKETNPHVVSVKVPEIKETEETPKEVPEVEAAVEQLEPDTAEPAEEAKPPVVEEKSEKPEMKKGLYTVAQLGDCLENLLWITSDTEFEAQYEGDGSGVPAKLRSAVDSLLAVYKQMAAEEADEAASGDDVEVVELADRPTDLVKMVDAKLDATKDDLVKSLTEAILVKVAEELSPLKEQVARLTNQPAGDAPKASYSVVDKVADAPAATDELMAKAADMEANPSKYTPLDRSDLAQQILKARNRFPISN